MGQSPEGKREKRERVKQIKQAPLGGRREDREKQSRAEPKEKKWVRRRDRHDASGAFIVVLYGVDDELVFWLPSRTLLHCTYYSGIAAFYSIVYDDCLYLIAYLWKGDIEFTSTSLSVYRQPYTSLWPAGIPTCNIQHCRRVKMTSEGHQ